MCFTYVTHAVQCQVNARPRQSANVDQAFAVQSDMALQNEGHMQGSKQSSSRAQP